MSPDRPPPGTAPAAILLCGHGTRSATGVAQFEQVVAALRARHPARRIAHGFLEYARPGLDEAVARLHEDGVRNILVLPVLLFAAGHHKRDLPAILAALGQRHAGLVLSLGEPIGLTPALLETARRLAGRAAAGGAPASAADTCLLVIGRGTTDAAVNAEAALLARRLAGRLGWGVATTGYVAVAAPCVPEAMRLADHPPFARVVVLPLVLFDGMLHRNIARDLASRRARSAREWRLADPFCTDDAWLATLDARIDGETMPCQFRGHDHHHARGAAS
jgi:sirohydrochlorin ferrochelatase